jgi:hypothetical protein
MCLYEFLIFKTVRPALAQDLREVFRFIASASTDPIFSDESSVTCFQMPCITPEGWGVVFSIQYVDSGIETAGRDQSPRTLQICNTADIVTSGFLPIISADDL